AAIAVGVAAGFLELGILAAQVRGLHLVDWSTLMISRHAAWMIPMASMLVIVPLTVFVVAPALVLATWRTKRAESARAISRVWVWTGAVLATLLVLGPLLAIRGFHPAAAITLALGIGCRMRRWVIWRAPGWQVVAYWAGGIAIGLLAADVAWLGREAAMARGPAVVPPNPRAPNLLWIVLDTLRADHMSLYGYPRPTTPELEAWAREGI